MGKHADYTVAQQERLEALGWAERMMVDLQAVVARDSANSQARADASLILSAVDEVITGREPKSISGKRGRMTRAYTQEEWQRLWKVRGLRQRISRPPVRRRRKQVAPGVRCGLAEGTWNRLVQLAGLDSREEHALQLHEGQGRPLREVARVLGVSRRQAEQIMANARRKLKGYTGSRRLQSIAELKSAL